MKSYIIQRWYPYEDTETIGVYTDKEKAIGFARVCAKAFNDYFISVIEFTLDTVDVRFDDRFEGDNFGEYNEIFTYNPNDKSIKAN